MGATVTVTVSLAFAPPGWHAPRWWLGHASAPGVHATGAWCIHEHEGSWVSIGHSETYDRFGHEYLYYGGMQFLLSTWRSVHGQGRPDRASSREQLYRAFLVWRRDGGSWREWGTRGACGLR